MRSRLVRVEDKMHDVVSTSDLREQLAMKDRDILRLKTELLQSEAKKHVYKRQSQMLAANLQYTPERMRPTPTATDAEKSSTDLTQTAVDPTLRLENLLNSTGPWIPPANPDALAEDIDVPPTDEVVDVAHNMNTKRAKTPQVPNSSKKLKLSGATGDELKKSNAGFLIADELVRLYSEGKFSLEPNRLVDKTMLYDEHHPSFVGVPITF